MSAISPFQRYNIYLELDPTPSQRKKVFEELNTKGYFPELDTRKPESCLMTINCSPHFLGTVMAILTKHFGFAMVELDKCHRYSYERRKR